MSNENQATSSPTPAAIDEAERLIILAQHIRSRLKAEGDDVHVLGMSGLALDIQAARCALKNVSRLLTQNVTPKEDRDHECG